MQTISRIGIQLKIFLSARVVTVVCLLIAFLSKVVFLRSFLEVGTDKAALLVSTKNFLAGHGISIARSYASDLAGQIYVPYTGWPPGYSMLLSPFMALFPENFMLAAFCLDVLAAAVFFIYLNKLLLKLGFERWLANLFLLFQGFFVNDYLTTSHPTDFLALAFIIAGWYYAVALYQKQSTSAAILASLFFFIAASVRYQYIPIIVAGFGWLLMTGMKSKARKSILATVTSLAIFGAVVGAMLLYQKMVSGNYVYQMPEMQKGWYPENLQWLHPFALHSLTELDFAGVQLELYSGKPYLWWMRLFRIAGTLLLLVVLFAGLKWLWQKWKTPPTGAEIGWGLGGVLSLTNLLLMLYLSVTNSPLLNFSGWTFVMDGRYFALPILFLQLVGWKYAASCINKKGLQRTAAVILIIVYAFTFLHGSYVCAKKTFRPFRPFTSILPAQPEMKAMVDFIKEQRQNNPGTIIAAGGTDNQFGYFACWYGAHGFFNPSTLQTELPKASKPVIVFFAVAKRAEKEFAGFAARPDVKLYKEDTGYFYYTFTLPPAP